VIRLEHGQPIRFGRDGERGVVRDPATGGLRVAPVSEVGADAILVHDAHGADPTTAFGLSRLADAQTLHHSPIGIFRQVERPTYDDLAREQVAKVRADKGPGDLAQLLQGADTWTVGSTA
jgi:2-oxoglutarate/2-oxoacid ferredoxin oxidoreductase subunit beta